MSFGTRPYRFFRKTIFRLLLRSEIFTRGIDQVFLAHTPPGMRVPQQCFTKGVKNYSIVSVFAPTTLAVEGATPRNFACV